VKKTLILLFIAPCLLAMFGCGEVREKIPISPPDSLPTGYEKWSVFYANDWAKYQITMEQKLDPDFWKQNIEEYVPPVWFVNETLGITILDSSPYDLDIIYALQAGDFALANKFRKQYLLESGLTEEQFQEVSDKWLKRNNFHNLSYFCLGVADKNTRTFMSNPNPADPTSPFSAEGDNLIVVEVLEDGVEGIMELSDIDIARIGLYQKGLGSEKFVRGIVERAQKAKFFLGATRREEDWESYSGYKPNGIFGIASRSRQPL